MGEGRCRGLGGLPTTDLEKERGRCKSIIEVRSRGVLYLDRNHCELYLTLYTREKDPSCFTSSTVGRDLHEPFDIGPLKLLDGGSEIIIPLGYNALIKSPLLSWSSP